MKISSLTALVARKNKQSGYRGRRAVWNGNPENPDYKYVTNGYVLCIGGEKLHKGQLTINGKDCVNKTEECVVTKGDEIVFTGSPNELYEWLVSETGYAV